MNKIVAIIMCILIDLIIICTYLIVKGGTENKTDSERFTENNEEMKIVGKKKNDGK